MLTLPLRPNAELQQALEGAVPELYSIGDCEEPGLIIDAVAAGFEEWRRAFSAPQGFRE